MCPPRRPHSPVALAAHRKWSFVHRPSTSPALHPRFPTCCSMILSAPVPRPAHLPCLPLGRPAVLRRASLSRAPNRDPALPYCRFGTTGLHSAAPLSAPLDCARQRSAHAQRPADDRHAPPAPAPGSRAGRWPSLETSLGARSPGQPKSASLRDMSTDEACRATPWARGQRRPRSPRVR